jgi:hypothetical protein
MKDLAITPLDVALAVAGLLGVALLAGLWRWWTAHRARRRLIETIAGTGFEHVRDVLVPDGNDGTFHVDFLVLTARGVLVVDLRDVVGNVFGADQMNAWTVMNGSRRHTFTNPQGALYDRVAAVKALVGDDVPVEGRVVFTRRARFPKGLPKWTVPIDSLRAEFPAADRAMLDSVMARFAQGWQAVKASAVASPLGNPRLG